MPIYEYQCKSCEHEFELLQRVTDDPLKECPVCGDLELTKLVSAAGFRLKGGGWYETDFKSGQDKKKNLVGSESGETKATTEKSETPKTESKPKADASNTST